MSIKAINAAFELPPIHVLREDGSDGGVSVAAKFLMVALADYADDAGRCWPKQETLARQTSLSEKAVRDTLALLERRGLIRRVKRYRTDGDLAGTRAPDIIHLLLPNLRCGSAYDAPMPQDVVTTTPEVRENYHTSGGRLPHLSAGQEPPREPPSLSLLVIREISGDALADPAKSLGIASYHLLTGIMTGDRACSLDDVKAGLAQAAAWYRGKRGSGSMSNYDLAAKLAGEARDARLAGAPPVTEGRTDDQRPRSIAKLDAKRANLDRAFAASETAARGRAQG